ncbi:tRNA 2-selenouridine(34) synthase MnmH [bacterium]|nr:tRNA 2-selenouridine(34) synthase MnmH [bacterium]
MLSQRCAFGVRRVSPALASGATAGKAVIPTRQWVHTAAASKCADWRTVAHRGSVHATKRPRALSVRVRGKHDDTERNPNGRGDGTYPEYFLDMGPRIRKVFPDEPDFSQTDWDLICDVRSPSEWREDHIPRSISTPVLDDEQRATVGTIYKQESPFLAKKVGASFVAQNLSKIMDTHFLDRDKDTKVLVYCWRGGERSLSLAHTLSRIGFQVGLVPGGYKRYRSGVLEFLRTMDGFRYHLIAGKTGCAKGKMLEQLRAQGAQVLDLEEMAQHRGSVLGEDPSTEFKQPSQKMFDTRLWEIARGFDRRRPIFVEGESSMIGRVQIPKNTWAGMRVGTVTLLEVPMESRVKWIRAGYTHFETTDTPRLLEKLQKLIPKVGHAKVEEWERWVGDGEWDLFVEDILVNHYDTAYALAAARSGRDDEAADFLMLPNTEDAMYAQAAKELIEKWDVSKPVLDTEKEKESEEELETVQ